jgi:hypothetical protein
MFQKLIFYFRALVLSIVNCNLKKLIIETRREGVESLRKRGRREREEKKHPLVK